MVFPLMSALSSPNAQRFQRRQRLGTPRVTETVHPMPPCPQTAESPVDQTYPPTTAISSHDTMNPTHHFSPTRLLGTDRDAAQPQQRAVALSGTEADQDQPRSTLHIPVSCGPHEPEKCSELLSRPAFRRWHRYASRALRQATITSGTLCLGLRRQSGPSTGRQAYLRRPTNKNEQYPVRGAALTCGSCSGPRPHGASLMECRAAGSTMAP